MTSQDKRWLNVSLALNEKKALIKSAARHKREIKQQAAVYIIAGLQRDGFIVGSTIECQCPHCGGGLTEELLADTLGAELVREVNE